MAFNYDLKGLNLGEPKEILSESYPNCVEPASNRGQFAVLG